MGEEVLRTLESRDELESAQKANKHQSQQRIREASNAPQGGEKRKPRALAGQRLPDGQKSNLHAHLKNEFLNHVILLS